VLRRRLLGKLDLRVGRQGGLKRDYRLNDSEVSVLPGAVAKYDVTELVDPQFNVVAKVSKGALEGLK